jgi:hypothetical protein
MVPREHGAYGQLIVPLLTAMSVGRPSAAALTLAIGAGASFVAHEPLLVLIGARGGRLKREERHRATRWLAVSTSIAAVSGAAGAVMLPAAARWTLLVPVTLAACAALMMASGRERTASGEIVATSTLASLSLPVAVAAGATTEAALTCTAAFSAGFAAATLGVRAIIGRPHRRASGRAAAIGTIAALVVGVGLLVLAGIVFPAALWASAPVGAVALTLALAVPPPRYLWAVGWTLVAATMLAGTILVIAIP